MPITTGAKKANRSSQKKRVYNLRHKKAVNTAVKTTTKHIAAGDIASAEASMPTTYKALDKAAKRGIIKPNTAARKKSRLAAAIVRSKKS